MEEEKNVKKTIQIKWALVLAIIAIVLYTCALLIDSGLVKEATELHTLIENSEDVEGTYSKITLEYLPYCFATGDTGTNTLKYYFALDDENHIYIIRVTDDTYEYLSSLADDDGSVTYEFSGYTFSIPDELKTIAIKGYNELIDDELLTEENFEEYFGDVYIDEINTPENSTVLFLIFIAKFLAAVAIVLCVAHITSRIKNRAKENKVINKEIEKDKNN